MAQSSPPLFGLPYELLTSILFWVRTASGARSFLSCLLCCKAWLHVARPLLYHDILLTNTNLEAFVKRSDFSHGGLIRSLTIRIAHIQRATDLTAPHPYAFIEDEDHARQREIQESKRLWSYLEELSGRLAQLGCLITFALTVSTAPRQFGFAIPRRIVAKVIEGLPETCVNLEIDTHGRDYSEPGSTHLCETIREIVPRLRNLRVRLTTICPAMFGHLLDFSDPSRYLVDFEPVAALHLETVLISCIPGSIYKNQAKLCGDFVESPYNPYSPKPPEARTFLVRALRLAVDRHSYPAAKRLWIIHSLPHDTYDESVYASLNRRDILETSTWALPFRNIAGIQPDGFLIRTPDGEEVLSYAWAIEALAEGENWVETSQGFRLPASLLRKAEPAVYIEKRLPIESTEVWRDRNPRKHCPLWHNEKMAGVRLLKAERRDNLTDSTPVREETPAGWYRENGASELQRNEA